MSVCVGVCVCVCVWGGIRFYCTTHVTDLELLTRGLRTEVLFITPVVGDIRFPSFLLTGIWRNLPPWSARCKLCQQESYSKPVSQECEIWI